MLKRFDIPHLGHPPYHQFYCAILISAVALLIAPMLAGSAEATGRSISDGRDSTESHERIAAAIRLALVESRRQLRNVRQQCNVYQQGIARNDTQSLINLANCFQHGTGRPKRLLRAKQLFEIAAGHGSPEAHLALGQFYRDGRIVGRDIEQAISHFRNASRYGSAEAMVELGLILRRERSLPDAACDWFERAADIDENYASAIRLLGDCYADAIGTRWENSSPTPFYKRAALLGDYTASLKLSGHVFKGEGSNIAAREGCAWAAKAAARYNQAASKAHAYCLSLSR